MNKQTKADAIDKIFDQVDPEVILAGALGGVAAYAGVVPPLTMILKTFGGMFNFDLKLPTSEELTKGILDNPILALSGVFLPVFEYDLVDKYLDPFGLLPDLRGPAKAPITKTASQEEKEKRAADIVKMGTMASAALEAMIVMTLVKNPATITAIGDAVAAGITAAGGAMKGGAALLGAI